MTNSVIQKPEPQCKPISLGEQISTIELMRRCDFKRAFPRMREAEIERCKLALDAAAHHAKNAAATRRAQKATGDFFCEPTI